MTRARAASAVASVVVAAGLLAGCSGGSSGSNGTASAPPWTESSQQDGLIKAGLPDSGSGRKVVDAGDTWSFSLAKSDDPNVPTSQWPSADSVLTSDQLKGAIPEASGVTLGKCVKGANGPSHTDKNASCKWSVTLENAGGQTNEVVVTIVTIGADAKVTDPWTSERNKNYKTRASGDRFFASGSFGAKGSYYLDNDQASVLISDGDIAAWINLHFTGFNALNNRTDTMLTGIFPVLAKDLADRMPRKYV